MPAVMVVPVGSTVDFPNQDAIFHNVFSLSPPAPFDLGLYRAGDTKKRTFAQRGRLSGLLQHSPPNDRIHRRGADPLCGHGGDGRYTLDLPAGSYRVTARSDRACADTVELTVKTGHEAIPDLTLDESRFVSVPHKNKFGQDYPASAYGKKGDGR